MFQGLILRLSRGPILEGFCVCIGGQDDFNAFDLYATVLELLDNLRQGMLDIMAGLGFLNLQYPCDALTVLLKSDGDSTQLRRVQANDNLLAVLLDTQGNGILDLSRHRGRRRVQ